MKAKADLVTSSLVRRTDLAPVQVDGMFELLDSCFDGVSREQFEQDLAWKNWVVILMRGEQMVGFSTLALETATCGGCRIHVLYSGDTLVLPQGRASISLPRAWIFAVRGLKERLSGQRLFWLLLTSGFRTYRFLPVFWKEFYPRFDKETPAGVRDMMDQLAVSRFGPQYDPGAGLVRFEQPQRLRHGWGVIPQGRLSDAHVGFFNRKNPGHMYGDELVCLTEIHDDNLTPAGRRVTGFHGR